MLRMVIKDQNGDTCDLMVFNDCFSQLSNLTEGVFLAFKDVKVGVFKNIKNLTYGKNSSFRLVFSFYSQINQGLGENLR
jgi:hypothetical protein